MYKILFLGLILLSACSSTKTRKGPVFLVDCVKLGTDIYSCKAMPKDAKVCPTP